MLARQTIVVNKTGLHARPASDLVLRAKTFESTITIKRTDGGEPVNAKSLVRILGEGMSMGTKVEIAADGSDEKEAVDALIALMASGFDE